MWVYRCVCGGGGGGGDRLMCTVGGLAVTGESGVCSEVSSGDVTQPVDTDECRKLSRAANCILMLLN